MKGFVRLNLKIGCSMNTLAQQINSLERHRREMVASLKRRLIMTIAIGLLCKQGIVLASDSQTTDIQTGRFCRDVAKIHALRFKDGKEALVAESGNVAFSSTVIEILSNLAKNEALNDGRSFAELAQKALGQFKSQLSSCYPTGEDKQRHLNENYTEIILADYCNGQNLFTLDFGLGTANRVNSAQYVAIGCGAPVASFLLDQFYTDKMHLGQAIATAIYVVEQVKKTDFRCQGPTKAGYTVQTRIISSMKLFRGRTIPSKPFSSEDYPITTEAVLFDNDEIRERVDKLNKFDTDMRSIWEQKLRETVYGVAATFPPLKK